MFIVDSCHQILSATLILALRERGFDNCSSRDGTTGFFVNTLSVGVAGISGTSLCPDGITVADCSMKKLFTILSSSEWYEITAMRPPLARRLTLSFNVRERESSSWFTSILNAWK